MNSVYVWWAVSAGVLIFSAARIGKATHGNVFGLLIDSRGRYSLSQFQITLWTVLVLSLLSGVFFARLFGGVSDPLGITIPNELLLVMGISVGSTTLAGAVKANKDLRGVPVNSTRSFTNLFSVEEDVSRAPSVRAEKKSFKRTPG